jgi:3-oxoacyl-[acyl-carrier-protein] synthase-3
VTVHLHSFGHAHPEVEITNAFLEELDIGTSDAWIVDRVGIRSRRTVLPLSYIRDTRNQNPQASAEAATCNNSDLGARAAELAIERAGIDRADVGMLIAGGSVPDTLSPAEACNIAGKLGLEVPAFDINSACTSLFVPLHLLSAMQPGTMPPFILLVVTETLTRVTDYNDRRTAVLWGDAAAAAVVSTSEPGRAEVVGTSLNSSPAGREKVVIPRETFFWQDGQAVHKFGIKRMAERIRGLQADYADPERPTFLVGHQANLRMLETVCKLCRISPEHHFYNVPEFGNTAAAGSPSVLSMNWDRWRSGDQIAVAGVGAGLTWGGYMLRFVR